MVLVLSSGLVPNRVCQLIRLRCHQRFPSLSLPRSSSTMSHSLNLAKKIKIGAQNGRYFQGCSKWECLVGVSCLEEIVKAAPVSSRRFYSSLQYNFAKDETSPKKTDGRRKGVGVYGVLNTQNGAGVFLSVIPCRSFKTARSIAAEFERNPSALDRLRNLFVFGPSKTKITIPAGMTFKDMDDARVGMAYARGFTEGKDHKPMGTRLFHVGILLLGITIGVVSGLGNMLLNPFTTKVTPSVTSNVTFDDVKGCAEAKEELRDVVKFLQNPHSFIELGGNLPKGVLLVGPPGSGKTLLARAVAGEASVPFFYSSCSAFDEVLVGEGARRVRSLFKAAKAAAPCVVFLDELDSVGGKRTSKTIHPYADQTINQLLTEMDGFIRNSGVIVLGATNRPDVLDPALLRPGRFDSVVKIDLPDEKGRKEILEFYLSKVTCSDIDVGKLVRITASSSGADLENLVNQATLHAVAKGSKAVTMSHMLETFEKIQIGPQKKNPIFTEKMELKKVAYHETGHALANVFTEGSRPLLKVTIKQTTRTLGHTLYMEKENLRGTRNQMLSAIYAALGGRAAEEVMIDPENITSGCLNDMQMATRLARTMVTQGLASSSLVIHDEQEKYSNEYLQRVDEEVEKILGEAYEHVKKLLTDHKEDVEKVASALVDKETLSAEEVYSILGIPLPEELKFVCTEEKFSSTRMKTPLDERQEADAKFKITVTRLA